RHARAAAHCRDEDETPREKHEYREQPTHRGKTSCRSALRRDAGLEDAEAHLVGRPLAPEDIAWLQALAADDRLLADGVVVLAGHSYAATCRRVNRLLQGVEVLPVEVPCRDVQQRPAAGTAGVELDPDVDAPDVHVTRYRVDRRRAVQPAVARRR